MTDQTTLARVTKLVAFHLQAEPGRITEGALLIDDLGADSLDVVELVMGAEEEFGVTISDADVADVRTVGEFAALVDRLGGVGASL